MSNKIFFTVNPGADQKMLEAMLTQPIGGEGENLSSLMDRLKLTDQQKYLLWASIIKDMQLGAVDGISYENNEEIVAHLTPIRQTDINRVRDETIETLISIIENFCDLLADESASTVDLDQSGLYVELLKKAEPEYWNESVAELAGKIWKLFNENDNIIILDGAGDGNLTIQSLKDADAGNNFKNGNGNSTQWVFPWENIDEKSYDDVRWIDQITDILKKKNKLQYTNNHSKWITLLMPQYGRRVEIEDLDRNFWVIAEVIDGISSWIFDTSPIPEIIKKLLDETTQLWENLIYLWTQIALMNQKKEEAIRVISFVETDSLNSVGIPVRYGYIPIVTGVMNEDETYTMTRVGRVISGREIEPSDNRGFYSYEQQYSEQTLCFLPLTRVNNYFSNYYNADWYERLVISKLGKQKTGEDYYAAREHKIYKLYEKFGDGQEREIVISPRESLEPTDSNGKKRFSPYILGSRFDQNKYSYTFPFSKTPACYVKDNPIFLYGALRTVPSVTFEQKENGDWTIKDLKITVYDAAGGLVNNNSWLGRYTLDSIEDEEGDSPKIYLTYSKNPSQKTIEDTTLQPTNLLTQNCENINRAYYLGETPSWRLKTAMITESKNLFNNNAILLKIGNFLPENSRTTYINAHFSGGGKQYVTQMRGNFTMSTNSGSNPKIYFYYPNWDSYDPSYDMPDSEASSTFCFTGTNPITKHTGLITEDFLAEQGLIAAKSYLVKTSQKQSHPDCDLWKKPCFFTTFVGLTPWYGTGQMYWDIAMVCHVYKYIPAKSSMKQTKTIDENYENAYDANEAYNIGQTSGIIYNGNGKELGKIITCHFINRYESYYDGTGFRKAMCNSSVAGRGDVFASPGWRAIKMIGAVNEEDEYCKLITIKEDDSTVSYAYDVKFSPNFEGVIEYYDAKKAIDDNHVSDFLTDSTVSTIYKVSEGHIKITNQSGAATKYEQIKDGAICKCGSNFTARFNNSASHKEKNSKETNFLIQDSDKERPTPFIFNATNKVYEPIINESGLTPSNLFNAWTGHLNDEYFYPSST